MKDLTDRNEPRPELTFNELTSEELVLYRDGYSLEILTAFREHEELKASGFYSECESCGDDVETDSNSYRYAQLCHDCFCEEEL